MLGKGCTVGQVRQGIVVGEMCDPVFSLLSFGDILDEAEDMTRRSLIVDNLETLALDDAFAHPGRVYRKGIHDERLTRFEDVEVARNDSVRFGAREQLMRCLSDHLLARDAV